MGEYETVYGYLVLPPFASGQKKRNGADDHSSFWGRFFSRDNEDEDTFGEKGYNRQDDDAVPLGDALSGRDKTRGARNSQDDGASSFYVPSKSTKTRPPIESEYFGSGDYSSREAGQFSSPVLPRPSQSSWLGPPPGIEHMIPPMTQQSAQGISQPSSMAMNKPVGTEERNYAGRQSIAPAAYGSQETYDYPGDEILQDEVLVGNDRANRESLSSYYSSSDADSIEGQRRRNTGIDSIYSTWGNASSVGARSAVSSSYGPWNERRPPSTRSSRIPQRKSTLKKAWVPQGDDPRGATQTQQLSRSAAFLTSQPPAPQTQTLKKPMAAMASTPVAVRNNVGFMSSDAPPMPLGWGHRS